jgi:hypothetical protein
LGKPPYPPYRGLEATINIALANKKMIEWIIILLIIFCIIVWHYSQSVSKYSLSQIKESQIPSNLLTLWEEKLPVVVSDVRPKDIWVASNLSQTRFWPTQPVWEDYQKNPSKPVEVPQSLELTWSEILGISQIESDTLLRWFDLNPLIFRCKTEAHIGPEGLRYMYGWATAISCTDGEARCILVHNTQKSKLPPGWKGLRWSEATVKHHPLWSQVKHIEVILRPSTVLLVPPHWVIAIEPLNDKPIWWTRTDLHHPISQWAQSWNEK